MVLAKLAAPQEVWELQTKYYAPFSPAKSGSCSACLETATYNDVIESKSDW